jgi:hypothetical protein
MVNQRCNLRESLSFSFLNELSFTDLLFSRKTHDLKEITHNETHSTF